MESEINKITKINSLLEQLPEDGSYILVYTRNKHVSISAHGDNFNLASAVGTAMTENDFIKDVIILSQEGYKQHEEYRKNIN